MRRLRDRVTNLSLRWKIGSLVVVGLVTIFVLFGLLGRAIADDAKQRTVSGWASIAKSTATVIDSQLELDYESLYILVCNEPGHFLIGVRTALVVK